MRMLAAAATPRRSLASAPPYPQPSSLRLREPPSSSQAASFTAGSQSQKASARYWSRLSVRRQPERSSTWRRYGSTRPIGPSGNDCSVARTAAARALCRPSKDEEQGGRRTNNGRLLSRRPLYACPLGLNMSMGTGTHILVYGARIFDVTRVAGGRSRCLGLPRARCYLEAH